MRADVADLRRRGNVGNQLDVVNAEQTRVPLAVVSEDERRQHNRLRALPVAIDWDRLVCDRRLRRQDRDTIREGNNRTSTRGSSRDRVGARRRRRLLRAVWQRPEETSKSAVLRVIVVRTGLEAAEGAVRVGVGGADRRVVVGRILIQLRGRRADKTILLVVRQAENLLQDIRRVDDRRGVVDRR